MSTSPEAKESRTRPLYDMFNAVPPRYDLVNHVITLGLDSRWRRRAVEACLAESFQTALDLGCGTGDMAIGIVRGGREGANVIGLDYSQPMLQRAGQKAGPIAAGRPRFVQGDAASLPFADGVFDCVGISFAFRNLTYKNPHAEKHIAEVYRVLRPGGRFVIIETSQPASGFIRKCYHFYLHYYVRRAGTLVSGNPGAYRYLAESAARYYTPDELARVLLKAGFSKVTSRPLFFGAAAVCVARK